jgi:hypothetical protein
MPYYSDVPYGKEDSSSLSIPPPPQRKPKRPVGTGSNGDSDSDQGGWRGALKGGGSSLSSTGKQLIASSIEAGGQRPVYYRKGGKVRKTGKAVLHAGERVIPKGKRKKVERMMKREGMRMKARR